MNCDESQRDNETNLLRGCKKERSQHDSWEIEWIFWSYPTWLNQWVQWIGKMIPTIMQ